MVKPSGRLLLWNATLLGKELQRTMMMLPGVEKAVLAGSLRRGKDTIGNIDVVLQVPLSNRQQVQQAVFGLRQVSRIIESDRYEVHFVGKSGEIVNVYMAQPSSFGAALLYYTGSASHNKALAVFATGAGLLLNKYGLFRRSNGELLAGESEEDIYRLLGLQYIPPELREDQTVIPKASQGQLPQLVSFNAIRGDMQAHSTWADGNENIPTIGRYVLNAFPHYEYMVIADPSSGEFMANAMTPADFREQFKEIAMVNSHLGYDFFKKGVEINLLENGMPDLALSILPEFDWVIATVRDKEVKDKTERLMKACDNPHIHCIGHIGWVGGKGLDAFSIDWRRLFEKAAATHTAIEIIAYPGQQEVADMLLKTAIEMGVYLVISSDAHTLRHFDYMQAGISKVRRGWCSSKQVLNTLSWQGITAFKQLKSAC
ncbi:DNA polymerase III [Chitinophaga jiangningensis]|nr:DNA polymerase III [Chitinophaga jiangningensis]